MSEKAIKKVVYPLSREEVVRLSGEFYDWWIMKQFWRTIHVGEIKLRAEVRNGEEYIVCPECGKALDPHDMISWNILKWLYCSEECMENARIKEQMKIEYM